MHSLSRWSSSSGLSVTPAIRYGPEQRHRHRAEDQPLGQRQVGRALAVVHDRAAGLVDRGRREVGGDHGGRVADAEEDQRRRHQRAAAHAGQADDDADEEAGRQDGEEGGGDQVSPWSDLRGCRPEQVGKRRECRSDGHSIVLVGRAARRPRGPRRYGSAMSCAGSAVRPTLGRSRASRSRPVAAESSALRPPRRTGRA